MNAVTPVKTANMAKTSKIGHKTLQIIPIKGLEENERALYVHDDSIPFVNNKESTKAFKLTDDEKARAKFRTHHDIFRINSNSVNFKTNKPKDEKLSADDFYNSSKKILKMGGISQKYFNYTKNNIDLYNNICFLFLYIVLSSLIGIILFLIISSKNLSKPDGIDNKS